MFAMDMLQRKPGRPGLLDNPVNRGRLVALLRKEPRLTSNQIADEMGTCKSTIDKAIRRLRKEAAENKKAPDCSEAHSDTPQGGDRHQLNHTSFTTGPQAQGELTP
jgi:IS30 family transposase